MKMEELHTTIINLARKINSTSKVYTITYRKRELWARDGLDRVSGFSSKAGQMTQDLSLKKL